MGKALAFQQKKQDLRHCGVPEVLHYGVMFNFLRYCGLDPQSHSLRHSEEREQRMKASAYPFNASNQATPYYLRALMPSKKCAFTLAEGASHGAMSDSNRKAAFTLAEVLITLGIIGIVAAMTLPTLIQNYKKLVTVNQLKATYSILSQAIDTSKNEHGEIGSWDFTLNNMDFAKKYILPYLKIVETKDKYGTAWSLTTLSTQHGYHSGYLFWNNGIINCPIYLLANSSAISVTNEGHDGRVLISVDINGKKGANVLGIDGFVFIIDPKRNQLVPYGFGLSKDILLGKKGNYTGTCIRDDSWQYYRGMYCGAVIMADGWQISDDYPWDNGGKTPIPKD